MRVRAPTRMMFETARGTTNSAQRIVRLVFGVCVVQVARGIGGNQISAA